MAYTERSVTFVGATRADDEAIREKINSWFPVDKFPVAVSAIGAAGTTDITVNVFNRDPAIAIDESGIAEPAAFIKEQGEDPTELALYSCIRSLLEKTKLFDDELLTR